MNIGGSNFPVTTKFIRQFLNKTSKLTKHNNAAFKKAEKEGMKTALLTEGIIL